MVRTAVFILALSLGLSGCVHYTYSSPGGFAQYKTQWTTFRAISSDGVKVRVNQHDNEPHGDSSMWMESVELYLTGNGYREISNSDIETASGKKGRFVEYIYNYYGQNYIYSLGVFVVGGRIFVVEMCGQETCYKNRRDSLIASIKNMKV